MKSLRFFLRESFPTINVPSSRCAASFSTTSKDGIIPTSLSNKQNLDEMENMSHLVSSKERYAQTYGMTPRQLEQTIRARRQFSEDVHRQILELDNRNELDKNTVGKMKHQIICKHRYNHRRNPFVCVKCWTHLPICVCDLFGRDKIALPGGVRGVYIWTHHHEWGKSSNTGSMLPLALDKTQMLMKGLPDHDNKMQKEVLDNSISSAIPVVLWPGKGDDDKQTVSISELRNRKEELVLVPMEGTWNNCRRMVNKLPDNILRLDLGQEISDFFSDHDQEILLTRSNHSTWAPLPKPISLSPSLLAPLRRQGKGKEGSPTNVSTLEATVIALMGLGMEKEDGAWILGNAMEKVDRIRRFTGKIFTRN